MSYHNNSRVPLSSHISSKVLILAMGVCIGLVLYRFNFAPHNVALEMTGGNEPGLSDHRIYQSANGSKYLVPNIVHFIWFGRHKEMSFENYISISSAHKIHRPELIMLHCDHLPVGDWWKRLQKEVNPEVHHMEPPNEIHGQVLYHVYHQGDVAKLQVLRTFGGIYLDYDVIVLQSLDPLRKYPMTMGKEKEEKLNAGVVVAHKDSMFLRMWYESYKDNYQPFDWVFNCGVVSYQIYKDHPHLVHVESYRLTTPPWEEREKIMTYGGINWQDLYVLHLMSHLESIKYTPEDIITQNNTFGEIIRHVYYKVLEIGEN